MSGKPTTRKIRPVRYMEATYYAQAACTGCQWSTGPISICLDLVKGHVMATGHVVNVERKTVSQYGPKEDT